jgi:hypothetical protein
MEAGEQLLQGIQEGQLRRVRAALAAGAAPGEFVGTRLPLQEAAEEGSIEIVRALLAAGADPNGRPLPGEEGPYDTPLVVAITNRHVDVAMQLIQAAADVNLACEVGCNDESNAGDEKGIVGCVVGEEHDWGLALYVCVRCVRLLGCRSLRRILMVDEVGLQGQKANG